MATLVISAICRVWVKRIQRAADRRKVMGQLARRRRRGYRIRYRLRGLTNLLFWAILEFPILKEAFFHFLFD